MPRSPRWTDEELTAAVAASASLYEVCRKLGLVPGKYTSLRRHIARLGIDASHLGPGREFTAGRQRGWTDAQLADAVRECRSIAELMRRLGYEPSGGIHRMIVRKIANLGLDTTHFVGQGWARGRTFPHRRGVIPLAEILVVNSSYSSTGKLRVRLIKAGLKDSRCEGCGLDQWLGEPLPLALDHVNGIHTDNRLENLRILCPNCHALTDTWCVRNRKPRPA